MTIPCNLPWWASVIQTELKENNNWITRSISKARNKSVPCWLTGFRCYSNIISTSTAFFARRGCGGLHDPKAIFYGGSYEHWYIKVYPSTPLSKITSARVSSGVMNTRLKAIRSDHVEVAYYCSQGTFGYVYFEGIP